MHGKLQGEGGLCTLAESFSKGCQREDSFIASLSYYLLTGRKGARLFQDENSQVVIADHPHIEDRLLIFPEIEGDGSLTARLLNEIDIPKNGAQLARYTDEDTSSLLTAAGHLTTGKVIEIQEIEETVMDWQYPIRILDTQETAELKGNRYEKLRNKFNKVSSRLSVLPLSSPNSIAAMRASLMFWAGAVIYSGRETGHSITEFYDVLFNIIRKNPNMLDGFIVMDGEEPAGFNIWDVTNSTANSLASLSRRSIKGMAEFQNVTACRILNEKGVKTYNMGGSETEGIDRHKLEYLPKRSIKVRSFEINVKNRLLEGIQQIALPRF